MRALLIAAAALALAGCTGSPDWATNALSAYGFKSIALGGWAMFGCDDRDQFHRAFTATNPTGQRVRGVVCGGWLKGATVRITGAAQ